MMNFIPLFGPRFVESVPLKFRILNGSESVSYFLENTLLYGIPKKRFVSALGSTRKAKLKPTASILLSIITS